MPLNERAVSHLQKTTAWLGEITEMIADILAHVGPSAEALAAAPVIERWQNFPGGVENLTGYVGGFEPMHWQAYTALHVDAAGRWAATMTGLFRLGAPEDPGEH